MNNSTCRACGKAIVYMKTKAGKSMPCDEPLRLYWQSDTGSQRIITHAGEVVRCELTGIPEQASGLGRTPHWGSCTNPDRFRKRGKANGQSRV